MTLRLTSPAFDANGEIPVRFTCEGDDASPPLLWTGVPPGTQSLALIVDDPDAPDPRAPRMVWVHWIVYDLPPTAAGLPEAVARGALPPGTREGTNDWKRTGYGGPCPPVGRHRYFHKLYALDCALGDLGRPDKAALERAMMSVPPGRPKGLTCPPGGQRAQRAWGSCQYTHVLAHAELVGTYRKSGRR